MTKTAPFRALIVLVVIVFVTGVSWTLSRMASAQSVRTDAPAASSSPIVASQSTADDSLILLNSAKINVKSASAQAERSVARPFSGKQMHLVRFSGPIRPEWRQSLVDQGFEIVDYIPNYTYLVYGDSGAVDSLRSDSFASKSALQWDGPFQDSYRISPDVFVASKENKGQKTPASDKFEVQLFKDPTVNGETLALADQLKSSPIKGKQEILRYVNFVVGLDTAGIEALSARPDVISIHAFIEPKKNDERQDTILTGNLTGNAPTPGDYLAYLSGKGFTQSQFDASNFLVDLSDSGIDNGTASPNHFALHKLGDPTQPGRVVYNRLEGTANPGSTLQGCDGHGNLNASIIAGYVPGGAPFNAFPHADASLFRYGLGVAPFVKVGSSVIFDPNDFTFPDYADLQSRAYHDGARISSNSWGAAIVYYTIDSQAYDALVRDAQPDGSAFAAAGNQEMVILFSAGNDGPGSFTVGSPGNAKNVITVGASENVQAFGGADMCGFPDSDANSAFDLATFSSRGPTSDARFKPDILLPGTHVSGTVAQRNPSVGTVTGNGLALTCFTASLVCGGPNLSDFWPLAQQWYTASNGTSHSTPAVAGFAALIRQDFINRGLNPPSPALTKGLIADSAKYLTGEGTSLPSNTQGMGLANLANYFDTFAGPHIVKDEQDSVPFTVGGQERRFTGTVADNTKPFRVTISWTDAPGSTAGAAYVNDLDLEVTVGGQTYIGNSFLGANSTPGVFPDSKNNTESVFLPAGVTGNFLVKVKALNIGGDGIPGNSTPLDQDFTLVVSNGNETAVSVVQSTGFFIYAENGVPANNSPDPGETLTFTLPLQEVGSANSTPVTATLLFTGGIIPITTTQNYGVLTAGGPVVSRDFTLKVPADATCGDSRQVTFQIQDGSNTYIVTKLYQSGTPGTSFVPQNFDGVVAPNLPAGWVNASFNGPSLSWVTSASSPSSSPNSAFAADPTTLNIAGLVSPVFTIRSSSATLSFQNSYNTEADSSDPLLGYDGMVLEVRIGSDVFQDIESAGATIVTGGYNRFISGEFGNPLSGRHAWSGNSGGFITTTVTLPPSANGKNVQFRWIMASDNGVGATGVKLDDISLTGAFVSPNSCSMVSPPKPRSDFDGDGKTDVTVYRPDGGYWFSLKSGGGGALIQHWGEPGDIPTPGDFDGDGKADVAVYRPSVGLWFILRSSDSTLQLVQWGVSTDIPVAADFDGDGKTDVAVYRPDGGFWFVLRSSDSALQLRQWGDPGDIPVVGDYDGDNHADVAIYRPNGGFWFVLRSSDSALQLRQWGEPGDQVIPGDFDGDGKTDVAVYRPDGGFWFILRSSDSALQFMQWGDPGDIPTPGDFDGDGRDDIAVLRPDGGYWFIMGSTSGFQLINWAIPGDIPIPPRSAP